MTRKYDIAICIVYLVLGITVLVLMHKYQPQTDTVIIAVHGGGWGGDLGFSSLRDNELLCAGVEVIWIDYTLGTKRNPSAIRACSDVWAAVLAARQRRGIQYVHLYGESAGGHIALVCAYSGCPVDSVIAVSAPTDLTAEQPRSIYDKATRFVGDGDRVAVSPCHMVYRATTKIPPTLLIHGEDDECVFKYHTDTLSDVLTANNVDNAKIIIGNKGHFIGDPVTDIVLFWLRETRTEN